MGMAAAPTLLAVQTLTAIRWAAGVPWTPSAVTTLLAKCASATRCDTSRCCVQRGRGRQLGLLGSSSGDTRTAESNSSHRAAVREEKVHTSRTNIENCCTSHLLALRLRTAIALGPVCLHACASAVAAAANCAFFSLTLSLSSACLPVSFPHNLQTIAYDYCDVHYRQAPADICGVLLDHFSQCGGKSNCTDFGCVDAPWSGACCARGLTCVRQHAFYHQCASPQDLLLPGEAAYAASLAASDGVVVGGSGGRAVDFIPSAAGSLTSTSSGGASGDGISILTGSSLASDILSNSGSSLLDPSAAGQPSLDPSLAQWGGQDPAGMPALTPAFLPKQPGKKIYTKLKIDTDYDVLAVSPLKMAHFKTDLVQWLKSVAASPEYIYGAGGLGSWGSE